jgi:hypothetical protein
VEGGFGNRWDQGERVTEREFNELNSLADEAYVKARDAAISAHKTTLMAGSTALSAAIPDIKAALAVRAQRPDEAGKFTGALTGANVEFLDPALQSRVATGKQIGEYLSGFPPEFLALAEEYLFKYRFAYASKSIMGIAYYYRDFFPDRGKAVAAKCFQAHALVPIAQNFLIAMLEALALKSSTPDIWQAYRTTRYTPLKNFARFLLAEFGDPDMKVELELLLGGDKASTEDREAAVAAYANYFPGTLFGKHVEIYRRFQRPETRLAAAKSIDPTSDPEANITLALIQGTDDKESLAARQELEANLKEFTGV